MGDPTFSEACASSEGNPACAKCGGEEFVVRSRLKAKLAAAGAAAGGVTIWSGGLAAIAFAPGAAVVVLGGTALAASQLVGKRIQCETCLTTYKPG